MKKQGYFKESERHSLNARGVKTRFKQVKLGYGYEKDFTEHELLWDKVTPARLIGLINNKDYEVVGIEQSTNSFGEFQFITLWNKKTNDFITFYGNGFHWARNRYIINYFNFYSNPGAGYNFYNSKRLGKSEDCITLLKSTSIEKIIKTREELEKRAKKFKRKTSEKIDKFEMIADEIGDEDFAYSETYM